MIWTAHFNVSGVAIWVATTYSFAVATSFKHLPLLLRAGLLGLLFVSVMSKPIASTWCETHQLVHTISALSQQHFHDDSAAERQLDAEHTSGAHGLLHGGDQGSTYADIAAVVTMPVVRFESMRMPLLMELPLPPQPVARLFRPPIA
jgi:hypothetical protein